MYTNPLGPGSAAAGLGLGDGAAYGFGLTWLFIALAVFTLIGAGWALMRVLPAGLTEKPRSFFAARFGNGRLAPPRHLS